MAVDQGGFGFGQVLEVDDAGLLKFVPKVVTLAGALAHAGEDGVTAVLGSNVVDELLDDDGFADAGAPEQADLAPLEEGLNQVDDLDAGLKHLLGGGLLIEGGRLAVNGTVLRRVHGAKLVHRFPEDI